MVTDDHNASTTPECRAVRSRLGPDLDSPSADVASHLERCSACRAESHRLNAAWALLNVAESRAPSPRFAAGVWAKIAAGDAPVTQRRPSRVLRWAAAGLAVSLAAAAPFVVWYRGAQDRPELAAQLDVMESHEMLANIEVVEDLDVLLSLDDP